MVERVVSIAVERSRHVRVGARFFEPQTTVLGWNPDMNAQAVDVCLWLKAEVRTASD